MRRLALFFAFAAFAAPAWAQSTNGYTSLGGAFFLSGLQKSAAELRGSQGGAPAPSYAPGGGYGGGEQLTPDQMALLGVALSRINGILEQRQQAAQYGYDPQEGYDSGYEEGYAPEGSDGEGGYAQSYDGEDCGCEDE